MLDYGKSEAMEKKIKIGVISLLFGENYEAADDLVAGSTVANLRKYNYQCDMLEVWNESEEEDVKRILEENYNVVFFAIPTTSNIPEIIQYSERIKELNKDCIIILMGWDHHSAPINAREVIGATDKIDIIIQGEGEETALDIVNHIKMKDSFENCKGIIWRKGTEIKENERRPLIENLDSLPFPVRDLRNRHHYKAIRISTARGCLGSCTFCPMSIKSRPVWRGRTPENIVAELKEIVEKLHIHHFMFVDPTFEDPGVKGKERIRKLAELIIKENLNITFLINIRAESWKEDDEELLHLLFMAGLESATVGIESGNKKDLELFHKRASLDDVARLVRLTQKYNIYLAYGFIMFHPYSTLEGLEENNEFLYNQGLAFMMGAYLVRLKAFPGTPIYEKIKSDGYFEMHQADQYSLYDYSYENEDVKRLAGKMHLVAEELQKRDSANYYEIQKLTTFVSRIQRQILKHDIEDLQEVCETIKEAVDEAKKNLNQLNYIWFKDCLNWVKENKSDEEFTDRLNQQFDELEKEINKAKDVQMSVGRKIARAFRKKGLKFQV